MVVLKLARTLLKWQLRKYKESNHLENQAMDNLRRQLDLINRCPYTQIDCLRKDKKIEALLVIEIEIMVIRNKLLSKSVLIKI